MSEEDFGKASFSSIANGMVSAAALQGLSGSFLTGSTGIASMSTSMMAYYRTLPSGQVLFTDNQVLLDLGPRNEEVIGRLTDVSRLSEVRAGTASTVATPSTPFAEAAGVNLLWRLELHFTSIFILTLDDLGFHDNQCYTRLASATFLTQALLLAVSVRATDNRFKEGAADCLLSAVTLGLINVTSQNEATHCLLILPANNQVTVREPNIIVAAIVDKEGCRVWQRLQDSYTGVKAYG
jgi:hypothetical protein